MAPGEENKCPNGVCNSDHDADQFAVGWFVVGDENAGYTIETVKGEQAAHDAGRDRKLQIYWTEDAAKDALDRANGANVTSPLSGELLRNLDGTPAVATGGVMTFDPATNTIVEPSR